MRRAVLLTGVMLMALQGGAAQAGGETFSAEGILKHASMDWWIDDAKQTCLIADDVEEHLHGMVGKKVFVSGKKIKSGSGFCIELSARNLPRLTDSRTTPTTDTQSQPLVSGEKQPAIQGASTGNTPKPTGVDADKSFQKISLSVEGVRPEGDGCLVSIKMKNNTPYIIDGVRIYIHSLTAKGEEFMVKDVFGDGMSPDKIEYTLWRTFEKANPGEYSKLRPEPTAYVGGREGQFRAPCNRIGALKIARAIAYKDGGNPIKDRGLFSVEQGKMSLMLSPEE